MTDTDISFILKAGIGLKKVGKSKSDIIGEPNTLRTVLCLFLKAFLKKGEKMIRVIFVILVASLISCGDEKEKKVDEKLENAGSTTKFGEKSQNTDFISKLLCANLEKNITCYNSINMESGDRSAVMTAMRSCLNRDIIFLKDIKEEFKPESDILKKLQQSVSAMAEPAKNLQEKGNNVSIEDLNNYLQVVVKNWNEVKNILKCE